MSFFVLNILKVVLIAVMYIAYFPANYPLKYFLKSKYCSEFERHVYIFLLSLLCAKLFQLPISS